ncbi:hypothetical protein AMTR_s00105p00106350 [Amborella trichopoda]|uniref:Uncharacterized protein n=1 Tax=Amborella trichopoda TaxID=13333 RepID=W1NXR6_AMBTC|nr:hypothetical protein AMTR_s00105p00106350 [Amborella trichopoda]
MREREKRWGHKFVVAPGYCEEEKSAEKDRVVGAVSPGLNAHMKVIVGDEAMGAASLFTVKEKKSTERDRKKEEEENERRESRVEV